MQFELKEIKKNIILLTMPNRYDLGMSFLRLQEYYESPNLNFKGKIFSIIDFMEWYSKEINQENCFSYCQDWAGFNIPSWVMDNMIANENIEDRNKYDDFMQHLYDYVIAKYGSKFYLIGSVSGDLLTIKHECAHAMYYLNNSYYKNVNNLIDNIHPFTYKLLSDSLLENMYCKESIDDEIQAYLSTILLGDMRKILIKNKIPIKLLRKPFIKLFNIYYNAS